jgi:hypothetical protein
MAGFFRFDSFWRVRTCSPLLNARQAFPKGRKEEDEVFFWDHRLYRGVSMDEIGFCLCGFRILAILITILYHM